MPSSPISIPALLFGAQLTIYSLLAAYQPSPVVGSLLLRDSQPIFQPPAADPKKTPNKFYLFCSLQIQATSLRIRKFHHPQKPLQASVSTHAKPLTPSSSISLPQVHPKPHLPELAIPGVPSNVYFPLRIEKISLSPTPALIPSCQLL